MTHAVTLREHLSRIGKIKTPATHLARSRNIRVALRTRQLMLTGVDKPKALEQARREQLPNDALKNP